MEGLDDMIVRYSLASDCQPGRTDKTLVGMGGKIRIKNLDFVRFR